MTEKEVRMKNGTQYLLQDSGRAGSRRFTVYRKRGDNWEFVNHYKDEMSFIRVASFVMQMERRQ